MLFLLSAAVMLVPLAGSQLAHAVTNDYTWTPIATNTDIYPYASASSADGAVSLSVGQRVYVSKDHGVKWQDITATLPPSSYWYEAAVSANGMVLMVSDDTSIVMSNDGGATWTTRTGTPTGIKSITMSGDGTKLALATPDFIYTSSDSGNTWVQQAGSGSAAVGIAPQYQGLAMTSDGSRLMALSLAWPGTGTYLSNDGGITWTRFAGNAPLMLDQLHMAANGTVATASSRSDYLMYVSRDGGATWTKPSVDIQFPATFISNDGGTILAFDSPSEVPAQQYVSHDKGITWNTIAGAVPFAGSSCGSSSSANLSTLVINDCYNVQVSNDGGTTWVLAIMQGNMWWAGAAASADGTKLIVTDADGSLYMSKDGGATWRDTTLVSGGNFFGVASSADGSRLAVAEDTSDIYLSNDGGTTWVKNIAAGTHKWYDLAMTPDGQKIVALANSDYIYISNDGGVTWTAQTSIAQGKKWNTVAISANGQIIVAAEGRYDMGNIFVSTDGGATWAEKSVGGGPVHWNDVAMSADGKNMVALDGYTNAMYVSNDNGLTWSLNNGSGLTGVVSWDHVAMSSDGSVILASDYSYKNVYVSTDGGLVWKQYNDLAAYYASASGSEIPVAMSADGKTLYVASGNVLRGFVKASTTTTPTPPSGSNNNANNSASTSNLGTVALAQTGAALSSSLVLGLGMVVAAAVVYFVYIRRT